MKRSCYLILVIVATFLKANAQVDPHFSQYYAFPLWLNPGMAGVMDGDYRVTGIYRNQWSSVMTPFTTAGLTADIATGKNLNLGADFMNQSAGDAGYKYLTASATIAYGIRLGTDKNQLITMGIRMGMLSRRFDASKFQFGDQWDPVTGYNPALISNDLLTKTSATVFDMGTGLSYFDARKGKLLNIFGGIAAFHLTRPEDPFISNNGKEKLPVRYTLHGGVRFNFSDRVNFTTHGLVMKQGTAKEYMFGLFTRFAASDQTDLFVGINYRLHDAISPFVGVSFNHFLLGLSYDVNNSDLGKVVTGTNSIELSLSYLIKKDRESLRYLSCPRF